MKIKTRIALLATLLLALGALTGCGGSAEEAAATANLEEWNWLKDAKTELDAKRAELAEARMAAQAPAETEEGEGEGEGDEASEGEETTDMGPPPAETIAALEEEIATMAEEFATRLVGHINSLEMVEGEPLTPEQQEVIRMKSDEDIEVAADWIEKGGDYRRAIDIYSTQLGLDPDYDRLKEALARAEEMRYPTEERFAGVEKGMSQNEVREVLGPVNLHNVVPYPEKNAIGWFFPKDPSLGKLPPSAVYFQEDNPKECNKLRDACEGSEDASACEAEAKAAAVCAFKVYQADYGATAVEEDEAE